MAKLKVMKRPSEANSEYTEIPLRHRHISADSRKKLKNNKISFGIPESQRLDTAHISIKTKAGWNMAFQTSLKRLITSVAHRVPEMIAR